MTKKYINTKINMALYLEKSYGLLVEMGIGTSKFVSYYYEVMRGGQPEVGWKVLTFVVENRWLFIIHAAT